MTMQLHRITRQPDVMDGHACIRGLRVTVATVVAQVAAGQGFERVLADYPYLTREDVLQALQYAALRAGDRDIALPGTGGES